jgi:malonyl-CoA O-methyltransferase
VTRLLQHVPFPDGRAARRAFDRAALSFDEADVVQAETRRRLLERLDLFRLDPRVLVDLGCATGKGLAALRRRYPRTRVLGLDASFGMLTQTRRRREPLGAALVCGDAERLPVASGSVDLLFANLVLSWCTPARMFAEAARVLREGGLLVFAAFGPATLQEVRRAWSGVDTFAHVHAFFDMHDLGDQLLAAGLAEPVVDVDRLELTYPGPEGLFRDLRASGAVNVADGRRSTLTGKERWEGFVRALGSQTHADRLTITVELIFGQAWGTGRVRRPRRGAPPEIGIPLGELGRRPGAGNA